MRIIEPRQLNIPKPKRSRKKRKIGSLVLLLLACSGLAWQLIDAQASPLVQPSSTVPEPTKPRALKTFTGLEFLALHNTISHADVNKITESPGITGSTKADVRIKSIAIKRGYKLHGSPSVPLGKTPEGFPLQPKAIDSWLSLKDAAAKDGINLGLVSTYRSVDEQRLIFMQRLEAAGASVAAVAAGEADDLVDRALTTTSIPGYSRHHTGYAADFKCGNEDFNFFVNTTCFAWLSKNNYQHAKNFGWIPSYPPDVANQGPDPEAWEYVWVGREALLEE